MIGLFFIRSYRKLSYGNIPAEKPIQNLTKTEAFSLQTYIRDHGAPKGAFKCVFRFFSSRPKPGIYNMRHRSLHRTLLILFKRSRSWRACMTILPRSSSSGRVVLESKFYWKVEESPLFDRWLMDAGWLQVVCTTSICKE